MNMDKFLFMKAGENMTPAEQQEKKHLEDLQRLRGFRPIDDNFMRCLFKDNIPLTKLVLRILTNQPDLVITEVSEREPERSK